MFIVGNEITITWVLAPTVSPLSPSDFDIRFVPSDLDGTYQDAAIINYTSPTEFFAGSIQYLFLPLLVGRYQIFLTSGVAASYTVLDKKDFWVFSKAPIAIPSTEVIGARSVAALPLVWSYTGDSYNMNSQGESQATTVNWMDSGNKLAFAGVNEDEIHVLDMDPPFDLGSAVFNGDQLDVIGVEAAIQHLVWKEDGLQFWTSPINTSGFQWVKEWSVDSTPWVIAGSIHNETKNGVIASQREFRWDTETGLNIYILNTVADTIHQWSVSVALDITSTIADLSKSFTPTLSNPIDFAFNKFGSQLWVLYGNGKVTVHYLTDFWDLATANATADETHDFSEQCPAPLAFDIFGPAYVINRMVIAESIPATTLHTFTAP